MRQTLNQLLTELDGFQQSEGVILLGATNLPQLLDKALTRPGRFDRHVAVPLPDVRGRLRILEHHSKAIKVAPGVNMVRGCRFYTSVLKMVLLAQVQVARGTPGFSGAQLENLVNQAAVKASSDGSTMVNLKHIEWAKE
jgi:ATP-dependent metalloprotease